MTLYLLTYRTFWSQWREEIHLLSEHNIPRPYFPKESYISALQLHGCSDASESAFAGAVYLRMIDPDTGV